MFVITSHSGEELGLVRVPTEGRKPKHVRQIKSGSQVSPYQSNNWAKWWGNLNLCSSFQNVDGCGCCCCCCCSRSELIVFVYYTQNFLRYVFIIFLLNTPRTALLISCTCTTTIKTFCCRDVLMLSVLLSFVPMDLEMH